LPSGRILRVPTVAETLRIKAFLVMRRNQTRDYLDVAALAEHYGIGESADVLARIDDYYTDQHGTGRGVAAQVTRQLADPRPADTHVTRQLTAYRNLKPAVEGLDAGACGVPGACRGNAGTGGVRRCPSHSAMSPRTRPTRSPSGPPRRCRPPWSAATS